LADVARDTFSKETTMPTMNEKLYPEQDHEDLCERYMRHVEAMTAEGLHEKSAIAGQLAWRDQRIEDLEQKRYAIAAELAAIKAVVEKLAQAVGDFAEFHGWRELSQGIREAHDEAEAALAAAGSRPRQETER
jgi:hypothetical protein